MYRKRFRTRSRAVSTTQTIPPPPTPQPPVLSSANTTNVAETTATTNVITDSSTGTLYVVVTNSATPPSVTTIKSGAGAVFANNQSITADGEKTFSVTGLSAGTTYYHHNLHNNAGGDSNIASSGAFTTSSSSSFILDSLSTPPTNAYSLRRLRSAYNSSAIRVRRSSDNAEQNIGFNNGVLDTSTLLAFIGSGDGFITTWFDQSGNGKDLTQATPSLQGAIILSGALITSNTRPYISLPNNGTMETAANFNWGGTVCMSGVAYTSSSSYRRLVNVGVDNFCFFGSVNGDASVFLGTGSGWNGVSANTPAVSVATPAILSFINDGSTLRPFTNGVAHATKNGVTTLSTQIFGLARYSGQNWAGMVTELIAWQGLSTGDRRTLEVNQGTFYGVAV